MLTGPKVKKIKKEMDLEGQVGLKPNSMKEEFLHKQFISLT